MNDITYISIVDDHAMFRKGLINLIELFSGYKVLFDAANGKEFIEKLNPEQPPDIVLLDINMPEMDGYETASWIRNNHPDIKVIALSTMDAEAAIIKMIRHGAKGYVLKDAEPEELKQAFKDIQEKGYFYNDMVTRKVLQAVTMLADDRSQISVVTKLSDREIHFLKLACSDRTYQQIASEMFVSERTVDGYRDALFKKFNVASRVGLAIYAIKNGIVHL